MKKQLFSEKNKKDVLQLIIEAEKYHESKQLIQANYLYQQVLQLQPGTLSPWDNDGACEKSVIIQ